MGYVQILSLLLTVTFCFTRGVFSTLIEEDKTSLLEFVNRLPHLHSLNWDVNTSVCSNWTGVTCNSDRTRIIAVRLPAVGFNGQIPANTISKLSALQVLSLRSNRINGNFPSDFTNLKNLTMLFLQYNELSGPLPNDFGIWRNLTMLNLSGNKLNGSIPLSIFKLKHLGCLKLANNSLTGRIPDVGSPNLVVLDLSYNNLTGGIPESLLRFPQAAFAGNHLSQITRDTSKNHNRNNWWRATWFLVVAMMLGILGLATSVLIIFSCCQTVAEDDDEEGDGGFIGRFPKGKMSPTKESSTGKDAKNGLAFFDGCNYAFNLEDLLSASAEVLGKGTFGMSYKTILEDANVVVVKRLKEVGVGRREFEVAMEVIGGVRHDNVVALRAYYYSKDEKLLVNDYCVNGSVSALLHCQRGQDRVPLDWETRLRIALGAARGLAHIHTQNNSRLIHGNIRSSNIFLTRTHFGSISDFGLAPIMSPLAPPIARAAGYRAPEVTDTRKATQCADVYSFGVFLLELLTGKSPVYTTGNDELVHLVRWVHSVVREEWTAEVFDLELLKYPHVEEEMVELLQIGLTCVARVPDQRPKTHELLRMIEDVRKCLSEN